jgi:alpha-beta hydrolase superfamily lysophospholipase
MHGLPRTFGMGRQAAGLLPELAEHLANDSGWLVVCATLSGVGNSTGTFSVSQWREDLARVVDRVAEGSRRLSLAAFGLGGALALDLAARDERIRGLAVFATPSDLKEWCGDPGELRRIVLSSDVVDPHVPLLSEDDLVADICTLDPRAAAALIPPRRLLIGHGADDREVPVSASRELLAAADGRAELRIIQGGGHWLRADPRMVATLLGWLDRHR